MVYLHQDTFLQGAALNSHSAGLGLSLLGTLSAPTLPDFLTTNPLPNGFPWSTATAATTNPYEQSPTTGVIRSYDFTITRGFLAPDGVNKSVLLVNNQFPAPKLEANWGDTFQITVHNQITGPEEGTALHWHGILQRQTPWFDGVPSVQQCPIAPGKSLTYTFKADLYGTSWYHSHYSAQYAGGLFGPMVIYGPKNAPYGIDIGPVILSDWYHDEYFKIVEKVVGLPPSAPPKSDNNLINGKMDYDCSLITNGQQCTPSAGISKFKFTAGKTHRLRLINAGAEGIQRFTIDNHMMTVIANDFVPVQPYQTNVVTLGVSSCRDCIDQILIVRHRLANVPTSLLLPTCLLILQSSCAPISVAFAQPRNSHMPLQQSTTARQIQPRLQHRLRHPTMIATVGTIRLRRPRPSFPSLLRPTLRLLRQSISRLERMIPATSCGG